MPSVENRFRRLQAAIRQESNPLQRQALLGRLKSLAARQARAETTDKIKAARRALSGGY